MDKLCYKTLEEQGYDGYILKGAPERVVQFGEGNFLRAFVDYWFDLMNERGGFNGKIVVVTPRDQRGRSRNNVEIFNNQDSLYTLYLQGQQDGEKKRQKRVISSISRCMNPYESFEEFLALARNPEIEFVVSNTTEAGIVYDPDTRFEQEPPHSYPGKIVRFLYERWTCGLPGVAILACELIDHNGDELKRICLQHIEEWGLDETFKAWVENDNLFCSSLVDRIVPGYPAADAETLNAENGYEDKLLNAGELFGLWVIEGPEWLAEKLPIEKSGLCDHILIVRDHTPYTRRKVRILNGAHTSFASGAYLAGQNIVRKCMQDEIILSFMNSCIYNEIIPTLDLPADDLKAFASSVLDRFANPYIDHKLTDICLNSTSKWKARVLPSLKEYLKRYGKLPAGLAASYAFYAAFYHGTELTPDGMIGHRDGNDYLIKDDKAVLDFFLAHKDDSPEGYIHAICSNESFWGEDLSAIPDFEAKVTEYYVDLLKYGSLYVMKSCLY